MRRSTGLLLCLAVSLSTVWAGREYRARPGEAVVVNEIIVRVNPGVAALPLIRSFLPGAFIQPLMAGSLYRVRVPRGTSATAISQLAANPSVAFVEPNRVRRTALAAPNDLLYSQQNQWGLFAVQALQAWSLMPAQYLTSATASTARVKVAVLDTGADCTHPDFINAGGSSTDAALGGQLMWSQSQALVPTAIPSPACPWQDDEGHGTHVTGILAAATSNSVGLAALGYPLQVMEFKVLDNTGMGDDATVVQAIVAAVNAGAKVISMSFTENVYSQAVQLAINYAWQNNTLLVGAAGNGFTSDPYFPASSNHTVAVSASDTNNNLAGFSNYGNSVQLAAPGVGILSTLPVPISGFSTTYCCSYGSLQGTSMSTPFVSALAGLVAMTTPNTSVSAILQRIEQTASSSVAGGGWSQNFGYGIINAYSAIAGATRPATYGGVVGQIIDTYAAANPQASAQITINGQTVTTDALAQPTGLFRFGNLAAGTYPVSVSVTGFPTQNLSVTVAPGADTSLTVAVGETYGEFVGQVTDQGNGVAGAIVEALSGSLIVSNAVADVNGNYQLWAPGGPSNTYNLKASAIGFSTTTSAAFTVAVGGTTTANLSLPRYGSIAGVVTDAKAHTVAGAQVLVAGNGFSSATTTNSSGAYLLTGVPSGTYSVTASIIGVNPVTQSGAVVSNDAAATVNLQFPGSLPTAATPVFNPPGGTFGGAQSVTITTATNGASIRYTTDGSTPTETNGTLYTGAVVVPISTTLKAIAYTNVVGIVDSSIASAAFTIGNSGWYNNAWSSRKAIVVNTGQVNGTLTNFPMLYSVTDASLVGTTQATGSDILFTASDGTTKLNHEIESYNSATGTLVAWVQVPALQSGTVLFVYWGNPASPNQQNAAAVWDSNYQEVFHFPNGAVNDSTAHADNGSATSVAATTGAIGGGGSFNGSTSKVDFTGNVLSGAFTMEAWVKATNLNAFSYSAVIGSNVGGLDFGLSYQAGNVVVNKPGYASDSASTGAIATGSWHHIVSSQDGSGNYSYYIDGAPSGNFTGGLKPLAGSNTNSIGYRSGYGNLFYAGSIDEVRISNAARSAAWIAAEYNNQKASSTFYGVGTVQNNTGGTTVTVMVTTLPVGLSLNVDTANCIAPCTFQWTPASIHTINVATSPQAGTTGTQYLFINWSDGGAQAHMIAAPSGAASYTANFATQYFLTTSATSGGSISPASGWNNSGSVVPVSATALTGYQFTGFSGSLTGATTPQNLIMSGPAAVAANFSAVGSGPGWYNNAWTIRKAITINSGQVSGTLMNFPMLYSVTDPNLVGNTQSNGNDILFTASDGVTKLNHEIESFSATTGTLAAWVQIPSLQTGTVIYVYYGNPSAPNQEAAAAVWDANFEMVQHLPNGTTLSANDSTSKGCNASSLNSTTAAAGEIAGGASLNGTSNSIDFAPCTALNNWTAQTISLWVKAQTGMAQYARLIEKGANNEWSVIWNYIAGSNRLTVQSLGGTSNLVMSAGAVADNTWHKVDVTISTGNFVTMYIDGSLSAQAQSPVGPLTTSGTIRLGQYGGGGYFDHGLADELRISNIARSSAWLGAEYNNEKSPETFANVGPTQYASGQAGITVTSAPVGLALSVDGTSCTAPCNLQWAPGSSHTINVSTGTQAGAPGTQYVFANWSDGGAQSHIVVAPGSGATYTANFATQYFLTTSATTGGTISPASGWNNSGAVISVSATALSGNQFTGFSGSLTGSTTPQNLTMSGPATVTANFSAAGSGPAWYNNAWTSRKAITVNSGQVTGTLTSFPMLYSVTDPNLAGNTQLNGNDILFTASDGITKLNHEIESYNGTTGTLVAWVKLPTLTTGTVIYVYYGNPGAANQQSAAGVWDSNFEMVQHLPNGTMLSANDSTGNGCNASTLNSTSAVTGEIAGGASFNGANNSIDFASCAALNNWTAQTISLWVNAQTVMGQYSRLIEKGANNEWSLIWNYIGGNNRLSLQSVGGTSNLVMSASVVADNTWHKVDVTISAGNFVSMYIDGSLSAQAQSPTGPQSTTGTIRLGQYGGGSYYYRGLADELRISNIARTAAWVAAEYNNEKAPAAFYTVGPAGNQ